MRHLVVASVPLAVAAAAELRGGDACADDAGAPVGVLCVRKLPGPDRFRNEGKGSSREPSGGSRDSGSPVSPPRFTVRVDGAGEVTVDPQHDGCIDGLGIPGDHVASVTRAGRPFLSAPFSFSQSGSNALELRYDPFYTSLQIDAVRPPGPVPSGGMACDVCGRVASAPGARVVKDVGSIEHYAGQVYVPPSGLTLRFVAGAAAYRRRTMVTVMVTAPPVHDDTAVRLVLLDAAGLLIERSSPACFEADVQPPPFATCTAQVGTGWDDGAERALSVTLDDRSGSPSPVQVRISVIDPLE